EYSARIHLKSKLPYIPLIKDRLSESRRTLFHTTCFGPWLDITYVDNDDEKFSKVSDEDAIRLCLLLSLERLLYDAIRNVSSKHKLEHLDGLRRNHNYVPSCSLSSFLFAIKSLVNQSVDGTKCQKSSREQYHGREKLNLTSGSISRAKVMAIKEAKDFATLPLDELIVNLKVYEMVLDNDGIASRTTKKKVKSLALKSKVTREQNSDDSDSQDESDKDEESNLMAKNFRKLSQKGVSNKNHLADNCPKPNNKAFVGITWSDSEDGDEPRNDATCLIAIDSQ
nr:phospholipase-like protein [Tanacetum cinerariifolium]